MLSYLEYRTLAIYHATRAVFARLDAVQTRFLLQACVTEVDALVHFNLVPLPVRRDVAMLGLIHRSVLGRGPPHFRRFFRVDTGKRLLVDPRQGATSPLLRRSAFGLVAVYNLLPEAVVCSTTVAAFQTGLQKLVRQRAEAGMESWETTLSPRLPLARHPLA